MMAKKFEEWARRFWGQNEDDVHLMLILDLAPIHKSTNAKKILESLDSESVLIPPGCTRLLQPCPGISL